MVERNGAFKKKTPHFVTYVSGTVVPVIGRPPAKNNFSTPLRVYVNMVEFVQSDVLDYIMLFQSKTIRVAVLEESLSTPNNQHWWKSVLTKSKEGKNSSPKKEQRTKRLISITFRA
jgi:hypothetical protein